MSKIVIPEGLSRKELHSFLIANKSQLIAQKKAFTKECDTVICPIEVYGGKAVDGIKQLGEPPQEATSVLVKVVANACWWCDSQKDVLIDNSAKRTIQQRKGLFVHLSDHTYKLEAQLGDVQNVYLENVPLRKLGVKMDGDTQCIIFETNILKEYNEKVFNLYRKGKVKQHSIGLRYIKIELAINDEDSEKEYDFWKKYYSKVINKEAVDEDGYFWVVQEIMLLENSAVLFGANELTPTLEIRSHSSESGKSEPPPEDPVFDLDARIKQIKFF